MGLWDDDAWDLIQSLLKVNPNERLGAGCFEWIPPPTKATENESKADTEQNSEKEPANSSPDLPAKQKPLGKVIQHGNGYDIIRQHPFFAKKHESSLLDQTNIRLKSDGDDNPISQPIPSLQDLAIRATAHFIDQSSLDVDLEDNHPPGDNSFYDALRLKPSDRRRVMHLLDRLHLLKEPRIYRRFFLTKQEARLGRVRPESRDVLGLTQINDKMSRFQGQGEDQPHPEEQLPTSQLLGNTTTRIHHVTNPLFCKSINDECSKDGTEAQRKQYIKQLKESIRLVNRERPTVVIACGYFDDSCRKILSKVNETVPVILHDGTSFFNFWVYGAHCVAMPMHSFLKGEESGIDEASGGEALAWFRMELEQIKTARGHGYVFVDGDPRDIPTAWTAKMGKSHILGLLGLCGQPDSDNGDATQEALVFATQFSVAAYENEDKEKADKGEDDDISTSSSESDTSDGPPDEHAMHIVGRLENGVRCITVREEDIVWESELLL